MGKKIQNTSDWMEVDKTADPQFFVNYLASVSALKEVRHYKQHSYALMGVSSGDYVLDVGCGTGEDVMSIADIVGRDGYVAGVDRSEVMIAYAKKKLTSNNLPIEYIVGDGEQLKFEDNYFSACRSDRVFQHLEDNQKVLAEMVRVVRPGGKIVISDPDYETLLVDAPNNELTRKILRFCSSQVENAWSGRQLYRLFKQQGLVNLTIIPTTVTFTDYAYMNQTLGLSDAIKKMEQAGEISQQDSSDWLSGLIEMDKAGCFFGSITGFTVCGEKPK